MSVQSVERTLDVLEALTDAGGQLTLSEIASRTGLPIGTIHRLLRTLVDRGYVRQESDRRYALGAAVLRFGPVSQRLFGDWARPYLARLVELSGETANMAVMEGDAVVYVAQVPSPRRLRMFAEVGRRVLPHCTAVGKVMLAHRDPAEARRVLQRTGLPRRTEHTITGADALLTELERVRAAGYAMDLGEEELGVHCAAVPVFEITEGFDPGRVVAAMSVSGPIDRIDALDRDRLVADMRTVAASFSAEALG